MIISSQGHARLVIGHPESNLLYRLLYWSIIGSGAQARQIQGPWTRLKGVRGHV